MSHARRVLLDTHVWVWWRSDPAQLSAAATAAIDAAEQLGLSAISTFEIAAKAMRGKVHLDPDAATWVADALVHPRLRLLDVTHPIAVRAALLGSTWHHGDPADRILVATALQWGWPVVSKDARIREAGLMPVIW